MTIPGSEERQRELERIKQDYPRSYWIIAGLGLVGLGVLIGFALFADTEGYATNLFTEVLSILITVLILDIRAEMLADRQLKAQLIREMGSRDNGIALRAVEELGARGWLTDGSLQNANLRDANLQDANLSEANLQRANLHMTNLMRADLSNADLMEANLSEANLSGAELNNTTLKRAQLNTIDLRESGMTNISLQNGNLYCANLKGVILLLVDLQGAFLGNVDMQEAYIGLVNLQGAWLSGVNLQGAIFHESKFDTKTILPDGSPYNPAQGIEQLERFTNPDHPDFWRPEPGSVRWYPADED